MILTLILSLVFFLLAAIHFHWVFGGSFGFAASLPTKATGERVLNPKKFDSAVVAIALTIFGLFYLVKGNLININLPTWVFTYFTWIIPAIFLLRAMGDFKYIGFFKRVKTTDFARLDNIFFSPLCLIIGVLGILIHVLN